MDVFSQAGIFIYPLGLCSFAVVFIMIERLIVLRRSRVIPGSLLQAFISGKLTEIPPNASSVAARIVQFYRTKRPTADELRAYARFEISRMERGMFLLEVVIGAAPLMGLLGTVTGLTQVFTGVSITTGLPEPSTFINGIALALNTTILGLAITIPAIAVHAYLLRRIEFLEARIELGVEALLQSTD